MNCHSSPGQEHASSPIVKINISPFYVTLFIYKSKDNPLSSVYLNCLF
jgi:hypothetical protein